MRDVTYDRPQKAKLVVRLESGEEWDATAEDFAKFQLDFTYMSYMRFDDALADAMVEAGLIERRKDITNCRVNIIRYLAELAISMPELLNHPEQDWSRLAEIERVLREHLPEE